MVVICKGVCLLSGLIEVCVLLLLVYQYSFFALGHIPFSQKDRAQNAFQKIIHNYKNGIKLIYRYRNWSSKQRQLSKFEGEKINW